MIGSLNPFGQLTRAQSIAGQFDSPTLISYDSQGRPGDAWSGQPAISGDGRFVAYTSQSTNLAAPDSNGVADIYLFDRLTDLTERITFALDGGPPNGWSYRPAISWDGRLVAFTSVADNLVAGDTNGLADVFVHDRLTQQTQRISVATDGAQASGWSDGPAISADGRYVVFSSAAADLVHGDTNQVVDVFLHDRLTQQTRRVSVDSRGAQAQAASGWDAAISADGRWIAFTSSSWNSDSTAASQTPQVFLHNRVTGGTQVAGAGAFSEHFSAARPTMSQDGRLVAYTLSPMAKGLGESQIVIFDRLTESRQALLVDGFEFFGVGMDGGTATLSPGGDRLAVSAAGEPEQVVLIKKNLDASWSQIEAWPAPSSQIPALDAGGKSVAFVGQDLQGNGQVYLLSEAPDKDLKVVLSGRVTGEAGSPLRSVSISAGAGVVVQTDRQGYFSLLARPGGVVTLRPRKQGFEFNPPELRFQVAGDRSGLDFTASAPKLLEEARRDIGMPYSFHRGCDSELKGCDGPFHGFYAGYCTDLILDAFQWGAEFNLQFALERDALVHPDHFYRWRNARNSHDMWRYFHYTDQILDHEAPYEPGDVIFFDWDEDSIIDHVSLVSEVNGRGRPTRMVDATGKISFNPEGLATELDWRPFHTRTVRGHGRWQGSYGAVLHANPKDLQTLLIAVDSPHVQARLIDAQGRELSASANPSQSGWPAIPGGRYHEQGLGRVLSVLSPLDSSHIYLLELSASQDATYVLHIQTTQGSGVTQYYGYAKNRISAGEVRRIGILLQVQAGILTFQRVDSLP